MSNKTLSQIAKVVGILLVIVSALADPLGLGRGPGFGWRQILGVVLGLVLVWRGFLWGRTPGGTP
jgi:hypothetical protein